MQLEGNIGIIGTGNMGKNLIGGLIANGIPPKQIWASDHVKEHLEPVKTQYGIHVTTDNREIAANTKVMIIAIKGADIHALTKVIAPLIKNQLIISIAAGVTIKALLKWFGKKIPIVRAMPNIASIIQQSATAAMATKEVSPQQKELATAILGALGPLIWVNKEEEIDTVTALASSGVAYFIYLFEILTAVGEKLGLSAETAHDLSLQCAYGASRLAMTSKKSLQQLRQEVTSPQGTTAEAIKVFEKYQLRHIFYEAIASAKARATTLSQLMEEKKDA